MMTRKWNLIVVAAFLTCLPSFAETGGATHGASTGTGGGTSGTDASRATGKNDLRPDETKGFASNFELTENFVQARWGVSGGDALEKVRPSEVKDKDEEPIAQIMAVLFGTRDNDQVKAMAPALKDELTKAKTPAGGAAVDARTVDFWERMKWAADVINEKSKKENGELVVDRTKMSGEEELKFSETFLRKLKDVLAKNDALKQKVDDAIQAGDKEAVKTALRGEVNHQALGNFLASAGKSKDAKTKEFAGKLADAVSFKDQNGNKFLDFVGPNGEKQRFHLGKSTADAQKAIELSGAKLGAAARFSPTIHDAPTAGNEWFINNGKFEKGQPSGFVPPAAVAQTGGSQSGGTTGGTTGGAGASQAPRTPGSSPVNVAAVTGVAGKCVNCHQGATARPDGLGFVIGGRNKTFRDVINAAAGAERMNAAIRGDLGRIEEWARAAGQ